MDGGVCIIAKIEINSTSFFAQHSVEMKVNLGRGRKLVRGKNAPVVGGKRLNFCV